MYDQSAAKVVQECKYGENAPQQPAFLYSHGTDDPLALDRFTLVGGDKPSYNNLADIDRLLGTVTRIAAGFMSNFNGVPYIAVGVKHGNACGAAFHNWGREPAVQKMVMGNPKDIFGGLVMLTFPVDAVVAEELLRHGTDGKRRLLDSVVAPSFTKEAIDLLARKEDKCRILANPALASLGINSLDKSIHRRQVRGGFLEQPAPTYVLDLRDPAFSTSPADHPQAKDIVLGWAVNCTNTSNTISLVNNGQLIGNGVGQKSRVSCAELAIKEAIASGHSLEGAVAISDSFFPFEDGLVTLAEAGIKTIFATSGSVKDQAVQDAADKWGVTLYRLPDSKARGFLH